jgi:hypothetical protein
LSVKFTVHRPTLITVTLLSRFPPLREVLPEVPARNPGHRGPVAHVRPEHERRDGVRNRAALRQRDVLARVEKRRAKHVQGDQDGVHE